MGKADEPPAEDRVAALSRALERLQSEHERLRLENEHLLESLRLVDEVHAELVETYDFAPLPLLTLDRAGTIRHVNHAGANLFGESRSYLLGRALRSLVAAGDRRTLAQFLTRPRSGIDEGSCELHLAPRKETSFPVRLRARRSSDDRFLQVAILDLRERARAVEEMHRLAESERLAREESTAKDKFIAILSHELRTPLTPVLAIASLMADRQGVPPEIVRVFQMIRRNVAMETRLIDDLLDVNRIVSGKMSIELQPTNVHQVAFEAAEILKDDVAHKHQSVHLELRAERYRANADPVRLRQLFLNLLRNAIKFTPAGGEIHVRSWNSGARLTVEVEDSGIGIPAGSISRLFAPFEQLDEAWTARGTGGGLGLGLAISKGIIDLHGGSISAGSRGPNQGARFAVQLETLAPLTAQEAAQERARERTDADTVPLKPLDVTRARGKPRILVVDDHPDTLATMAEVVEELGYDVETADSVSSALAMDFGRVDMIVSDIGLPDGSGLDLMRELRTKGRRRPAIAISGFGRESDVKASRDAGFDVHLTKPVDFKALVSAIRTLNARATSAK